MTLDQLRIFVVVAELRHVTRAARQLHITQSTASAAIGTLERRHGVLLFDRVGRGLELTEAGRVFLAEANGVLARADAASRALDDLAGLRRGELRIGASQTVASYWLPQRMASYAKEFPGIVLHLQVGNTAQIEESVVNGAADIGFVEGKVSSPFLVTRAVDLDRLSIYSAPDHPLAAKKRVSLHDLSTAVWIMREPGSGTRAEFQAELGKRGVASERLTTLLTLPSNEAVMAAVAEGGTLTAVSDRAAAPHVAAGTLRRVSFDLLQRSFTVILHRERLHSPALKAFLPLWPQRADRRRKAAPHDA
jgi:DNA-binding transcriptional LysR family regulator